MIPALALQLEEGSRWLDDLHLTVGGQSVELRDGLVFPIHAGDVPAGFVFVGTAEAALRVDGAAEAEALADPLQAELGIDASSLVRDRRWTEHADLLVVLGRGADLNGPVRALPLLNDSKTVSFRDATGQEQVVVDAYRPDRARAKAAAALAERAAALTEDGLDPSAMIALDAFREDPRWLVELHTDHDWKPFLAQGGGSWLALSHDPTGAADDSAIDRLFVHDRGVERVLARHGAPGEGAHVEQGKVNLVVQAEPAGAGLDVTGEAVLDLVADSRTGLLSIAIPYGEERPPGSEEVVPPHYSLDEITVDGRPVARIADRWGRRPEGTWDVGTWRVEPPLEAGQRAVVRVRWTDRWAASHPLEVQGWGLQRLVDLGFCSCIQICQDVVASWPEAVDLGRETVEHRAIPTLIDRGSFPTEVRLGTTLGPGWRATISGGQPFRDADDGRWTVSQTVSTARVALGRFTTTRAEAMGGFPAVEILSADSPQGSASFLRAALKFYQPVLPGYPYAAIALVEAPPEPKLGRIMDTVTFQKGCPAPDFDVLSHLDNDAPPTVAAYPAQAVIHAFREVGTGGPGGLERNLDLTYPDAVDRGVVHALVSHWWDRPEYADEDRWIAVAAEGWYRDRFVDEAWSPKVADAWERQRLAAVHAALAGRPYRPVAGSPDPEAVGVGILRAVGARIGEPALLRGLDQFLRQETPTTAALEAALARAGGVDLTGFLTAWVQAGIQPEVDVTWSASHGTVRLDVRSDVPYGSWAVPISVSTKHGEAHLAWVDVVDGTGHAELVFRGTPDQVEVDPQHWLPIRGSKIQEAP